MRKQLNWIIAVTMISASAGLAQAGSIVTTASGNIGGFTMTNEGIAGGTARIDFLLPVATTSELNTVNGGFIPPELAAVNTPAILLVTQTSPGVYDLALVPPTYTETIGTVPGAQAVLDFDLKTGATMAPLPDFFNASGNITGVSANANPLYDFGIFAGGGGNINLTFTATEFTGGAADFAELFATPGATAVGNGSFSQAVSEPTSFILALGILVPIAWHFARSLVRKCTQSASDPSPVH